MKRFTASWLTICGIPILFGVVVLSHAAQAVDGVVLARGEPAFAQEDDTESEDDRNKRMEEEDALSRQSRAALAPPPRCFTSGSNDSFFKVCITDHGTISSIEAPAGQFHINGREGYAVCSNAGLALHGFDAGIAENGWRSPTISQPNGAGKLPLVITRNSFALQLKQTFTLNAGQREVSVKMDVKNVSATDLFNMRITRYFDGDIDNSSGDDIYELTLDSVVARNSRIEFAKTGHGLMLSSGSLLFTARAEAEPFAVWNPLGLQNQTARKCFGLAPAQPSPTPSDQVGRLVTNAGNLQPGETTSVTFLYRVF